MLSLPEEAGGGTMFDVEAIRKDFPILQRTVHGKPLVYLDNAATSQKPHAVIDAIVEYYEHYNSNIHRGLHTLGRRGDEPLRRGASEDRAVHQRAGRAKASSSRATPLSRSTSWRRAGGASTSRPATRSSSASWSTTATWSPGRCWRRRPAPKLRFVDIDDEGLLRPEDWQRLIGEKTKLVALTQMSNVLGTINPVREIAALAHALRRSRPRRRGAERAPYAGRRAGPGLRFPCLLKPQDARAHRRRRTLRPPQRPRGDGRPS